MRTISGLLVLSALSQAPALAQFVIKDDAEDRFKPWQEIAIELPSPPLAENLVPFYASATATQSFALDSASLSVGTDGVVRYTLIATSSAGARNVSYEGIRCSSFEKKLYAFGRQDGSWSKSRNDRWLPISGNAANRHHAALAREFLCMGNIVAGTPAEMLVKLRKNQ